MSLSLLHSPLLSKSALTLLPTPLSEFGFQCIKHRSPRSVTRAHPQRVIQGPQLLLWADSSQPHLVPLDVVHPALSCLGRELAWHLESPLCSVAWGWGQPRTVSGAGLLPGTLPVLLSVWLERPMGLQWKGGVQGRGGRGLASLQVGTWLLLPIRP